MEDRNAWKAKSPLMAKMHRVTTAGYYRVNPDAKLRHERQRTGTSARQQRKARAATRRARQAA